MESTDTLPQLVDSTLREGEQFARFAPTSEQKREIALALARVGVAVIEVTNPASSPASHRDAAALARLDLGGTRVAAHIRCVKQDVVSAVDAGVTELHFFIPLSSVLRQASTGMCVDRAIDVACETLTFARALLPRAILRLTGEDTFRASDTERRLFYGNKDLAALVDRWGVADTTGCAHPRSVTEVVGWLRSHVRGDIEFHGHNDTGCAVANALLALESGATHIDTSVLGLGERNGIAPLEDLLAALWTHETTRSRPKYDLEALPALVERVASIARVEVPFNKCLVGETAFTHKAGVHVRAVLNSVHSYECLSPALVGRERTVLMNHRLAGRAGLAWRATELGLSPTTSALNLAYARLMERADAGEVSLLDLDQMLLEAMG